MRRPIFTVLITLLALTAYGQEKLVDQIENLEGIWIAEDYLHSFDKTYSSIKSIDAFDSDAPVGLRINKLELMDSFLNIGYSYLHDHFFHPEVSKYIVVDGDTLNEQGHFQINIQKSDSLNLYETSKIYYFNDNCKAYFSWKFLADTIIILYRPATDEVAEKTIRFKRICRSFKHDYLFPNPIYYYTRSKTLVNAYTLRDSLNTVVSNDFRIDIDGKSTGYVPFENKIFFFSTVVYCGLDTTEDYVLYCSYNDKLEFDCNGFIYKRIDENTIHFHKSEYLITPEGDYIEEVGKIVYKLTRK